MVHGDYGADTCWCLGWQNPCFQAKPVTREASLCSMQCLRPISILWHDFGKVLTATSHSFSLSFSVCGFQGSWYSFYFKKFIFCLNNNQSQVLLPTAKNPERYNCHIHQNSEAATVDLKFNSDYVLLMPQESQVWEIYVKILCLFLRAGNEVRC